MPAANSGGHPGAWERKLRHRLAPSRRRALNPNRPAREYFDVGETLEDFPTFPPIKSPSSSGWTRPSILKAQGGFRHAVGGLLLRPLDRKPAHSREGKYFLGLTMDRGCSLTASRSSNGGRHHMTEKSGEVELAAGHAIKVDFLKTKWTGCLFSWRPPEGTREIVPSSLSPRVWVKMVLVIDSTIRSQPRPVAGRDERGMAVHRSDQITVEGLRALPERLWSRPGRVRPTSPPLERHHPQFSTSRRWAFALAIGASATCLARSRGPVPMMHGKTC